MAENIVIPNEVIKIIIDYCELNTLLNFTLVNKILHEYCEFRIAHLLYDICALNQRLPNSNYRLRNIVNGIHTYGNRIQLRKICKKTNVVMHKIIYAKRYYVIHDVYRNGKLYSTKKRPNITKCIHHVKIIMFPIISYIALKCFNNINKWF